MTECAPLDEKGILISEVRDQYFLEMARKDKHFLYALENGHVLYLKV